jgi:tetratricopeptide (TPR) repeat protein
MAEKHQVDFFFLSHKAADTRALIADLHRNESWPLIYFDELAMIFLRRTPENQALIDRYEVDLAQLPASAPFANLRSPGDFYLGHTNRALVYSGLGHDDKALAELRLATGADADSFVTLTALAIQLGKGGDIAGSVAACRNAIRARPGYAPARFWLGIGYQRQAKHREAIAELAKALSINPETRLAHYAIARSHEATGDTVAALEHYRAELARDPRHRGSRQALARLGSPGV